MAHMYCHWSDVREECLFDLCKESTRDHGKLVKGSPIKRVGSYQQWAGKHRLTEDGELVCDYATRPRHWVKSAVPRDGQQLCPSCGRALNRILNADGWDAYRRWRGRTEKKRAVLKAKRALGFKPWFEPGEHRKGPGGKRGRFWTRKHVWAGDHWECGYTTPQKAWKRERWASLARDLRRTPCPQCGRPLPPPTLERQGIDASSPP